MCEFAYNQYFFEKEGAVLDSLQLVLIIITFTLIFLIWHVTLQNQFRETVPTKKKKTVLRIFDQFFLEVVECSFMS